MNEEKELRRIAIFCGSSLGADPVFAQQAYCLGQTIARRGSGIVYGGAHVGLMGEVARGVLDEEGEVIGVIPEFLQKKELAHNGITQNYIVSTMHERKAKMEELCDGVIALPGGYGTMDELFEILTWAQLSLHKKPIGLLNVEGFYDPLIEMSEKMIEKKFVKPEYRKLWIIDDNIERLLDRMNVFEPLKNDKWFVTSINALENKTL